MIFYSHQVQQLELCPVAITCILLAFRSVDFLNLFWTIFHVLSFFLFRRQWVLTTRYFLVGVHLQSLYLSNLQQIFGRYGGKIISLFFFFFKHIFFLELVVMQLSCFVIILRSYMKLNCEIFLNSIPTQVYFGMLDALLAAEQLPEEYRNRCQVHCFYFSYYSHWSLS